MATEEFTRVRALFEALDPLPPDEQAMVVRNLDLSPEGRETLIGLLGHEPQLDALRDEQLGAAGQQLLEQASDPVPTHAVVRIGSYDVRRLLGEGGMGVVYACHDRAADRELAVKVIRPGLGSEIVAQRFHREGNVLRQLDHPAIAAFDDFGETEVETDSGLCSTQWFLAMELVRGAPIHVHAKENKLGASACVELIAEVAEALQHAHQRGVIHRDLKPQNILVEPGDEPGATGQPKIVDFGIADETQSALTVSLTGTGELIGTPSYMSPEQIVGGAKGLDARSDVYSLGVVLFELLTGELPYAIHGQPLPQIARTIVEDEPTRLGSLDTRFRGSPLELVLGKALEKSRAHRYQDMASFADDLRRFLLRRTVSARPLSPIRRGLRFARRHKVFTAVMVALAFGSVFTTMFAMEARAAQLRTEATAYEANLAAAATEIANHDPVGAEFFLSRAPERLRGWEWEHLQSRLDDSESRVATGGQSYRGLSYSADGRTLYALHAKPSQTGATQWQVETVAVESREVSARRDLPEAHDYVLDGELLIHSKPNLLAERLADGGVHVDHGRGPGLQLPVLRVDAPLVSINKIGRVFVEGERVEPRLLLEGYDSIVAVGPAARWAIVAQPSGKLEWWSLEAIAQPVQLQAHPNPVRAMAASADGRLLATGGDLGELSIWAIRADAPPRPVRKLRGHEDSIGAVAFAPDGSFLVSGGEDRAVRVWDVATGQLIQAFLGHRDSVHAVAVRADGGGIASASAGEIRTWAFDGANPRRWFRGEPFTTALGPRGRRLYCGLNSGTIAVYDLESGLPVAQWRPAWMQGPQPLQSFGVGGKWLAVSSGNADGTRAGVRVLDLETGATAATLLEGPAHNGYNVAVSPDGSFVAAHGGIGGVRLWRTSDWKELVHAPAQGDISFTNFSPDGGQLVTTRGDGTLEVRDVPSLSVERTLPGPGEMAFHPVFSLDGAEVAAPCLDGVVRVWDLGSQHEPVTLAAPNAGPWMARSWPEIGRFATGDRDGTVTLWDRADGQPLFSLRAQQDFVMGLWLVNGSVYCASADGTVQVWDTRPLRVRNDARRRYRRTAEELTPVVEAVIEEKGSEAAAAALARRSDWTDREREIAQQLLLGRLFGRSGR